MHEDTQAISNFGQAHRRYAADRSFGMSQSDRLMHTYIIGQTGTGKSTLLGNLILQDAEMGRGFCMIDPHGDLAASLKHSITREHIYWHVSDPASPYGYNPLTRTSALYRPLVASGLIDTLKKQWADAWGARMEHLLRYAILALLECPRADLSDVTRIFYDRDFQKQVIPHVSDPQVLEFWTREYPSMNYKTAIDGVAPIANKIGSFLAHPVLRKAVCDPEHPLRFRSIMDEGKGIIVNLAKGQLGSDTANVLGGLLVSSIVNAAFTRYDVAESERRPFFLYVDEFPSFSTSVFANALSEVRKYGLGLTLAHQHVHQADRDIIEAILGNVGSIVVFRIGVLDAPLFVKQMETLSSHDLIRQPNHRAYLQLMVQGQRSPSFSADMHPPFYG